MEKKRFVRGHFYAWLGWGFIVCLLILMQPQCSGRPADPVEQAYLLRINGNADSAKVILERVLNTDSTNATAWYELARTKHHIGLGNPQILFTSLDEIRNTADKAAGLDPGNIAFAYYRGYLCYIQAYVSMMRNQPDVKEKVKDVVSAYESVLKLRPDYPEAVLFMVEIMSAPDNMGGDRTKAEAQVAVLEEEYKIWGAKARELLLSEEASRTDYWQNILQQNPGNADVLEQLGKTYLYQNDTENGVMYLEQAMKADPAKTKVLLDLGRFYFMTSRNDPENAGTVLPKAEVAINRYLETEPMLPLQAFAVNLLSWVKHGLGEEEEANRLKEKANALDPNVSKAFGVPPALLFNEPGEVSTYHAYFSRPF